MIHLAIEIARPAADAPGNDEKAENKAYPENRAFGSVAPAVNHGCEQKQGDQLPGCIVNHKRRRWRILRVTSYATQKINPITIPSNMLSLHPTLASIGALTLFRKVLSWAPWEITRSMKWRCESFFDRPTNSQPSGNSVWIHSKTFGPLGKRQPLSVKFDKDIRSLIVLLLLHGGPSTIFGAIALRVVDTINRMFRCWPISHIGKEIFEALPAFTDCYAFGRIIGMPSSSAAFNHSHPSSIDRGVTHAMRGIYYFVSGTSQFAHQAPTRFRLAFTQGLSSRDSFLTAIANTIPAGVAMICKWASVDYNQSPETFTSKIYQSHRSIINNSILGGNS